MKFKYLILLFTLTGSSLISQISVDNLSGTEVINIDKNNADAGQISINNATGQLSIKADGSNSTLGFYDLNDLQRILFSGETGAIEMKNSAGQISLGLNSDNFGGGKIVLLDDSENVSVEVNAKTAANSGGSILMNNNALNRTIRIDAQADRDGGLISIKNNVGNDRINLFTSNNASHDGGIIRMFNSFNEKTLALNGNQYGAGYINIYGPFSDARIQLYGSTSDVFPYTGGVINMMNRANVKTVIINTGTNNPDNDALIGSSIVLKGALGNDKIKLNASPSNLIQGGRITLFNSENNNTLRLAGDFNNSGKGRVITDELELNGGSDFAEYFNIISEEIDLIHPGYIVSIDSKNPGKIKMSSTPHDRKVIGIVSGANGISPGMMMGQDGTIADGDTPIAIAGRVYVKCTNDNGKIEPGDFLTTSIVGGHAMKVQDIYKSMGAIIGKALTNPDENNFVLVLVNLQ